jgi:hypothetical protein
MEEKTPNEEQAQREPGCFVCSIAVPMFERLWPEATRDHLRNSRIEFLKAIRSLIDDRISYLSRHEAKGTHVTVE